MRKQVAYLGPKGTYAEKAAHILSKLANFQTPIFVPCNGLHSVIKSIAYNNCDAGVVPIENSVEVELQPHLIHSGNFLIYLS